MSVNITVASTRSGSGTSGAGQELLDLPEHGVGVARPRHVVDALELDVARAGYPRRELLAGAPVDDPVPAPMEHERRHVKRGQHVAHVDVQEHLEDLLDHRRAGGGALQRALNSTARRSPSRLGAKSSTMPSESCPQ